MTVSLVEDLRVKNHQPNEDSPLQCQSVLMISVLLPFYGKCRLLLVFIIMCIGSKPVTTVFLVVYHHEDGFTIYGRDDNTAQIS